MIHIKTHTELDKLRASADLVSRTLAEVARHLKPGVTTGELDAIAEDFVRSHDAEPAFKGYQVGSNVYPATLCISIGDEIVHGIPGDRIVEEGQLVSVDCGVVLDGYYGDSAFTFGVGELSEAQLKLATTTYESLYEGIDKAVTGNRVGDIGHAVQEHCESEGFGVVYELVGHGIGKSLHEEPQIPNVGRRGSGRKLSTGMTLCIEPMINMGSGRVKADRDGWTVRTVDGRDSAHYEHMIVVLPGQAEILSTFEYIEEVLPPPYKTTAVYDEAAIE
jgi:methionyl aminopeptidase